MLLIFAVPKLPAHMPSGLFKLFLQVPVNTAPLFAGGGGASRRLSSLGAGREPFKDQGRIRFTSHLPVVFSPKS